MSFESDKVKVYAEKAVYLSGKADTYFGKAQTRLESGAVTGALNSLIEGRSKFNKALGSLETIMTWVDQLGDEEPEPGEPASDPSPDPKPEPDDPTPEVEMLPPVKLIVDGEQIDYAMGPPDDLVFGQPHPRFTLPTMFDTDKYDDAEYGNETRHKALQHVQTVDAEIGRIAVNELLEDIANNPLTESYGKHVSAGAFETCLYYDWLHDLFTPEQRVTVFEHAVRQCGLKVPEPGSNRIEEFDDTPKPRQHHEYNSGFSFGNDAHEPGQHAKGFLPRILLGVTFLGDGIRDEWCQEIIDIATSDKAGPVYKMYGHEGSLIAGQCLLGLDSGGCQAGHHNNNLLSGYNGMFFTSPMRLLCYWYAATGDRNVLKSSFLRYTANYLVNCHYQPEMTKEPDDEQVYAGGRSAAALTIAANLIKDIEPDMAGLTMWALRQNRKRKYGNYWESLEHAFGDRGIESKSPDEINLPLSAYLRGADEWVSRNSWDRDTGTVVSVTGRTLDTNRYEKHCNLLRISVGKSRLCVSGQAKKGGRKAIYGGGVWIFNDDAATEGPDSYGGQDDGTYWGGDSKSGKASLGIPLDPEHSGRLFGKSVLFAATHPAYRGIENTATSGPGWARFQQDASELATWRQGGKQYRTTGVFKNERTVLHLFGGSREFVLVRDIVDHASEFDSVWGMRSINRPIQMSDNTYRVAERGHSANVTFLNPGETAIKGGDPKRTEGPYGESYHGSGYYFQDTIEGMTDKDAGHILPFGEYSLWQYPPEPGYTEYLVLFEIDPAGYDTPSVISGMLELGDYKVNTNTMEILQGN